MGDVQAYEVQSITKSVYDIAETYRADEISINDYKAGLLNAVVTVWIYRG